MPSTPAGAENRQRLVVGVVLGVMAVASLVYLQTLFDKSDHRKAIARVQKLQTAPGAPTFGAWLAEREAGAIHFEAAILSGCRGLVRVTARPPTGKPLAFDVDLVANTLDGVGSEAEEALEAYREATSSGEDAPAPAPESGS